MTRRTSKEIEIDYKRIKEGAKSATSMRELEKATGLTYAMIKTTLSKHPIVFKRIKETLEANHQNMQNSKYKFESELKSKAEFVSASKSKTDAEAKCENKTESKTKAKTKARVKTEAKAQEQIQVKNVFTEQTISTQEIIPGFVIDASITGVENLKEHLLKICNSKAKIIITSITIKELEKLQHFDDIYGKDARNILAMAAENSDSFESVLIDETFDTPDDCIINYCAENKDNVTLLTSDKTMALKARMYSVQVHYFKQAQCITAKNAMANKSNIRTLIPAKRMGNSLLIPNFHTDTISIRVCSNGLEYNDGIRELQIGDDVFLASKKSDCVTFAHYHIISLYAENNCELIFSRRIYDYSNLDLPKASYKSFVRDFLRRHNLI